MWWIAKQAGKLVGFASLRPGKKGVWFDCSYVVPAARGQGVHTALSDARDKLAAAQHPGQPMLVVVRQSRWHHYRKRQWKQDAVRGSWVYARKEKP
jgi:GNAT superfamily N-acetyltransferase